ncbi:MAG: PfkB family carbohydrate kinase [Marmoricola sp.]
MAVGLARLEAPTLLITEIGVDERARRITAFLHDNEVEFIGSPSRDGRTATAAVHLEHGEPTYEIDLRWTLPHQELPHCDALHVGSLATVLEPGRDSVLDLVEQAWSLDVFVSYDPNIRAVSQESWGDVESLADRANLVKLSEHDIELLHPGADPDDVARSLLTGDRTELVVLTRGSRGATAFAEAAEVSVPGLEVEVVDTVGAGDAFTAGLLALLLESGSFGSYGAGVPAEEARLEPMLRAAVEVAALSCSRPGAAAPSRSQLRQGWPD